mmetsp:Transcript_80774/g.142461  ORF Transcript_80774/g.142461 Transcript_80774/m.142461 type:complete len:320 (-) Transcript_80774:73-1032(-)|eukprot:CAMPEP_0197663708 /NCGR_PEP_ID=MMETSP1338-20131121/58192_1 /TAXON_ID=43686 ORGANISM="Pelagodinium beii, Strain RCC1491" /NCGR_SAMPLE_ID=MMETSP1338 /ASSEMBLY_ACC=CAM_ASM_000754 /LENGTH=319 /DNA_ID=CAMNT_0043242193 /DNA_START=63 /DNA_END=1022 /DNA_ORIENTATION=-
MTTSMRCMALAAAVAGAAGMKCPGSASFVHAWAEVTAKAGSSCSDVKEEIEARASAGEWVDPHNGGTYKLLSSDDKTLELSRTTGNKKYTDKMSLTLSDESGSCLIEACSESQVFSIADFSTNYCNLHNLFCGSDAGCKFVKHDLATQETEVKTSTGASKDTSACIVKPTNVFLSRRLSEMGSELFSPTTDALGCVTGKCPMDNKTLIPSPMCIVQNCLSKVGKCIMDKSCRDTLMCESKCTGPLGGTEDAPRFAHVQECIREKCPGFPPSKSCVAMHCATEASHCALHSKCRNALSCANGCLPHDVFEEFLEDDEINV